MAVNEQKLAALDAALKTINSKHKSELGNVISKFGDAPQKVETISSGSLVLDSILGGGFGRGRVVEIFGMESSGKTTIALETIAHAQANGEICAFIDLEQALDPAYASKLGVDVPNLLLAQPDHAEMALQLVDDLAASNAVDLIVIDSVAALVPKAELEGELEQQTIGLVARLLSRALKKLVTTASRSKTTIIFINQNRVAIGGYSPVGVPMDTTGGKALKYFASQRVEVKRGQQIKEGSEVIGNETKFAIKKNKIAPPFRTGSTVIAFNKGINRPAELLEVAPKYGVIERPNNRTYIDSMTEAVLGKSKAEALEVLENDQEVFERLSARLKEVLAQDDSIEQFEELS